MLISERYTELNRRLHENPYYGTSGRKYAARVLYLTDTKDILDYGCGKKTLEEGLGFPIQNYDPAVEGCSEARPAAFVVCTDVLEHIEPECLENVLRDLKRVTVGQGYFTVAWGPAKKVLEDGRNAHLIQEGVKWWLERLSVYFNIEGCVIHQNGFEVFV